MAAGIFTLAPKGKLKLFDGTFDLGTDQWYVSLLTAAVPLTAATCPEFRSGLTSLVDPNSFDDNYDLAEVGLLVLEPIADFGISFTFYDTADWDGTIEAKWAVVHRDGVAGAGDILGYVDLNTAGPTATVSSIAARFRVEWSPNGLFTA